MAYCWKCGVQLNEGSSFCQSCGAPAKPPSNATNAPTGQATSAPVGQTGFERLGHDRAFQDHWAKRVIAYVIDVVIVSVALFIISLATSLSGLFFSQPYPFILFWGFWFGGFSVLVILAYFVLAEGLYGRTLGKELMGLKIVRVDSKHVDLWSSFVRNLSKIAFILLVIDLAVGLGTHGDGYQKFSDRYIGTTVKATNTNRIIPDRT